MSTEGTQKQNVKSSRKSLVEHREADLQRPSVARHHCTSQRAQLPAHRVVLRVKTFQPQRGPQ